MCRVRKAQLACARFQGVVLRHLARRFVERTYTHKQYDDKQVNQQIKMLGMQMIITAGIHIMARMTTPLLLACTQPVFQLFDPVFQSRVLGRDVVVKRPAPDPLLECATHAADRHVHVQHLAGCKDGKRGSSASRRGVCLQLRFVWKL